jgi:hypothetical protein
MAADLIVAPEAEQDLVDAYGWYEERRAGLGEEFLSCVDACIEAVRRAPEMCAVIYENYRRALPRRFPYAVFYEYVDGRSPFIVCSIRLVIQRNGSGACPDSGSSLWERPTLRKRSDVQRLVVPRVDLGPVNRRVGVICRSLRHVEAVPRSKRR